MTGHYIRGMSAGRPLPTFDERAYGSAWADLYDEIHSHHEPAMIDLLAELAGEGGSALELAVGTGRVAVPLSERGVQVTGIDLSKEMLAVLASKESGVTAIHGDMAEFDLDRRFSLVYIVFNSLFALSSQDRQVACFRRVAEHLEPGGRFLVDCFVPDLTRFDDQNTRMSVVEIGDQGDYAYEMGIHDPVDQEVKTLHVRVASDGAQKVLPVTLRYAWPAELDLMGRLADLDLESRWAGYDRSELTEASGAHVSVYRKPR